MYNINRTRYVITTMLSISHRGEDPTQDTRVQTLNLGTRRLQSIYQNYKYRMASFLKIRIKRSWLRFPYNIFSARRGRMRNTWAIANS
ncbi:hypothetical protein ACJX0J_038653, partial [Zea mays]